MAMCLGTGILNWDRHERVSDRYGTVKLLEALDSSVAIQLKSVKEGTKGTLYAIVKETRQSQHIGDLFRGIFPETPNLGERIVLGHGLLFYDEESVGLEPEDGRDNDWLDPHKLYRVHEQTVDLFFEPSP